MDEYDVGILAAMLDDDDDFNTKTPAEAHKGDLELQLESMEKQMAELREKIQKQKSTSVEKTEKCTPKPSGSKIVEVDLFQQSSGNSSVEIDKPTKMTKSTGLGVHKVDSVIHSGDTDSSEDEDNRQPMMRSLNGYGQEIKRSLASTSTYRGNDGATTRPKATWNRTSSEGSSSVAKLTKMDVKDEPTENYGGVRVVNPLVSSATFNERLVGRKLVQMHSINPECHDGDLDGDWVTVGVIVNKSEPKVSAKGNKYSVWGLSNLKGTMHGIVVVSLFLFGETHNALWKTSVGTVVGILNARLLPPKNPKKNGKNEVSLTVDNALKVMLMGKSKDFGFCRATRRDGISCMSIVNKQDCEYCEFHVQSEYKKVSSKRMDLQTSFSSSGAQGFKERVLRKEQIMYGGVSYMAQKPEKLTSSKKAKDKLTLQSLDLKQKADSLLGIGAQNTTSAQLLTRNTVGSVYLNKLMASKENKQNNGNFISVKPGDLLKMHAEQMKARIASGNLQPKDSKKASPLCQVPQLGKGHVAGESIDLNFGNLERPAAIDRNELSKLRAIAKLRSTEGTIKKQDPNAIKKIPDSEFLRKVTKRLAPDSEDEVSLPPKKQAMDAKNNEEMMKVINRKSKYDNLLNEEENTKQEQYFHVLEKKEMLENKMLSIKEIPCTAVSCKQCNYTALSAAETCKAGNHPLKYHKATKRFFKCKDCSTRTISLNKLPTKACGGCGGGNFERAAMWAPRKGPTLESEQLSIRGDEIKWLGNAKAAKLNLSA